MRRGVLIACPMPYRVDRNQCGTFNVDQQSLAFTTETVSLLHELCNMPAEYAHSRNQDRLLKKKEWFKVKSLHLFQSLLG